MEKSLDITKPFYSEHILAVPWPFVISRSPCNLGLELFLWLCFCLLHITSLKIIETTTTATTEITNKHFLPTDFHREMIDIIGIFFNF